MNRSKLLASTVLAALLALGGPVSAEAATIISQHPKLAGGDAAVTSQAADTLARIWTAGDMSDFPTKLGGVTLSSSAWEKLLPQERADLFNKLGLFGRAAMKKRPEGIVPFFNIGLGYDVYFHDISPSDQKFFLETSTATIAGIICLTSAGAACVISSVLAGVLGSAISNYFNPSCWMTLAFDYSGNLDLSEVKIDHC